MKPSVVGFPHFGLLPYEIRAVIWKLCLPHRVFQLHAQACVPDLTRRPPLDEDARVEYGNSRLPLITRVCHEARAIAMSSCLAPLPTGSHNHLMLDALRDTIHLNWRPDSEVDDPSSIPVTMYGLLASIKEVIRFTNLTHSRCASITLELFQALLAFASAGGGIHAYTREHLADLLMQVPSWSVLVTDPIIIHADRIMTGEVAHLSRDAPVQIVDVNGDARFRTLWAASPAFSREPAPNLYTYRISEGISQLSEAERRLFDTLDVTPDLQPAIMFRLHTGEARIRSSDAPDMVLGRSNTEKADSKNVVSEWPGGRGYCWQYRRCTHSIAEPALREISWRD